MQRFLVLLPLAAMGCDTVTDVLGGVKPPEAALSRVDLVHAPTTDQLLGWQCRELGLGFACGSFPDPATSQLFYSFDLVFNLSNPNKSLPIPLVEILMGMSVYDLSNLGAACVSFCNPDEESCVPAVNAEGSCAVEESDEVKGPEDLLPTVDEMVGLAETVAAGDVDNGDWRVIPGGEAVEGHIQFDLAADVMLALGDNLLGDAVDDAIAGRNVSIDVPYVTEGTVFFDVPELGRKAIGFGPLSDSWTLE